MMLTKAEAWTQSSLAAEKKTAVNIDHQEVAKVVEVTSHNFGRKKDGSALMKSTEKRASHLPIERRAGWLGWK